jgi:hypothetical protein
MVMPRDVDDDDNNILLKPSSAGSSSRDIVKDVFLKQSQGHRSYSDEIFKAGMVSRRN